MKKQKKQQIIKYCYTKSKTVKVYNIFFVFKLVMCLYETDS